MKKAIDYGRLVKSVLPDGTIDPVIADQEWATNTNPQKQANGWKGNKKAPADSLAPKPPAPIPPKPAPVAKPAEAIEVCDPIDFNQARTNTEIWKSKTAELEYKKAIGEYVRADDVKNGIFGVLTVLRTHVMGIHSKCRLQADLPAHTVALIEHLCRDGLEDAAKALEEIGGE